MTGTDTFHQEPCNNALSDTEDTQMSHGQLIPFTKKARPRNPQHSWKCPMTGEKVIDSVHASGSPCWSTLGKPLQIIPAADGWRAVYRYETEIVMQPVVCWVLTEF